jgi:hypothetical protein
MFQHRFIPVAPGRTTVYDPTNEKTYDISTFTVEDFRAAQDSTRSKALVEAKRRAKWWGTERQVGVDVECDRNLRDETPVPETIGGKPFTSKPDVSAMAKVHEWVSHYSGPETPLRVAVKTGQADVVSLLLRAGFDPNDCFDRGVSLLHMAVWNGDEKVSRLLLEGEADPNLRDSQGQTPMFFVPKSSVCSLLVEFSARLYTENFRGQTPFHLACRAANKEVIAWMRRHGGRGITEKVDKYNALASYYAKQAGVLEKWLERHDIKLYGQ